MCMYMYEGVNWKREYSRQLMESYEAGCNAKGKKRNKKKEGVRKKRRVKREEKKESKESTKKKNEAVKTADA